MKRILVIDDSTDLLYIMEFLLAELGHEIIIQEKPMPVEEIPKMNPDRILLDNHLSDSLGSDLCSVLKASPRNSSHSYIIAINQP